MPAGQAQTTQTMEKQTFSAEQQKVLSTIETMVAAFHKKDIDGVMACYEPAATIVFEPQKPVSGNGVLRAGFEEIFTLNPAYQFHGHEVNLNFQTGVIEQVAEALPAKIDSVNNTIVPAYQQLFQQLPQLQAPTKIDLVKKFIASDSFVKTFNLQ